MFNNYEKGIVIGGTSRATSFLWLRERVEQAEDFDILYPQNAPLLPRGGGGMGTAGID